MSQDASAHSIIVTVPSDSDEPLDIATFLDQRFRCFVPSHNSAIIIGGTDVSKDEVTKHVLDASSNIFERRSDGVATVISMATCDGLGESPIDERENESTGRIAAKSCTIFNSKTKQAALKSPKQIHKVRERLFHTARESSLHALKRSQKQWYESRAAMTTAIVSCSPRKNKATLTNIGDTMLLVVDGKSFKIKLMMAGRLYCRGFNRWSPSAVQDLVSDERAHQQLEIEKINLNPGDTIIQVTDGMRNEFLCHSKETKDRSGDQYIEETIDRSFLESVLQERFSSHENRQYASAFEIADSLTTVASRASIERREQCKLICEKLRPHRDTIPDKTITLASWLSKLGLVELETEIRAYIKTLPIDGPQITMDGPAAAIAPHLEEFYRGDCATVSVMRVPSYKVELIRALIDSPMRARQLLSEIIRRMDDDDIDSAILHLRNEKCNVIEQNGSRYSELNLRQAYDNRVLDSIVELTRMYRSIHELIYHMESIPEKLEAIKNFLLELNAIEYLIILFDVIVARQDIEVRKSLQLDHFFGKKYSSYIKKMWPIIANRGVELLEDQMQRLKSGNNILNLSLDDIASCQLFSRSKSVRKKVKGLLESCQKGDELKDTVRNESRI